MYTFDLNNIFLSFRIVFDIVSGKQPKTAVMTSRRHETVDPTLSLDGTCFAKGFSHGKLKAKQLSLTSNARAD